MCELDKGHAPRSRMGGRLARSNFKMILSKKVKMSALKLLDFSSFAPKFSLQAIVPEHNLA